MNQKPPDTEENPFMKRSRSSNDVLELIEILNHPIYYNYYDNQNFIKECLYNNADDRVKKYEFCKQVMCGNGQTKYSKIMTKFVDQRIDAFCTSDILDEIWITKFQKSIERVRSFCYSYSISLALYSFNAIYQKNISKLEREKFEKITIFWFLVEKFEPMEDDSLEEFYSLIKKYQKHSATRFNYEDYYHATH